MQSELSLPPLFVRHLYLAYKFTLKSFSVTNNVTIDLLETLRYDRYWEIKRRPLLIETYNETKQLAIYSTNSFGNV